ncbi:MAG: hypothetical protein Q9166_006375 [cf. Caloplaca sp. 2 TL-2023]
MGILDFPTELLLLIPQNLNDIKDYTHLSSSCRKFREVCSKTSPNMILRLAAASSRTFFRPGPHFLIAATVRQVSDWALLSNENTEVLRQGLRGGVYHLLDLCVNKAGLTMDDIRRLHAARFSLINPVSDMIDRCVGPQWLSTPEFWSGGVSNPATVSLDPARSLFQIIIYGELFASTVQAFLEPSASLPRFDQEFRMDYIKYCIPDRSCRSYTGMTVLEVGPYAGDGYELLLQESVADQVGLDYLLGHCRTWKEAWERVRLAIGPNFDDVPRQILWERAVQAQGLEGLEMLRPGGLERWRPRLEAIRREIEKLPIELRPKERRYGSSGRYYCWESPDMAAEITITLATYWGET